ncbi:MAG: DUF1614 domain-containing protein [Clostridiales bacterium]|nr:DUF1614 domain-containing protein [Clostridiales bacterium]MCF8023229.1 DUF1614 domain-containing protein [Clostridiales bacterium]
MTELPIGLLVLIVVSLLIYFGLAQRVLDRLRLSDRSALIIIGALIVGSFITIPVSSGNYDVSINVGGGIIPLVLAGYLLVKARSYSAFYKAGFATIVTAGVIYGAGSYWGAGDTEPGGQIFGFLDAVWAYPLIAGVVAYITGRSRRAAFIAATLGVMLTDVGYLIWLVTGGQAIGTVAIGGGGAFDTIVLSGIVAVLLAEIIGEVRERAQKIQSHQGQEAALKGLKKPVSNVDEPAEKSSRDKEGSPE